MQEMIKKINNNYQVDYWLLAFTPVLDTINGLFLIKKGATGFSLGTIYRLFFLIYLICGIFYYRKNFVKLLPLLYFPIVGFIRGFAGGNLFGCVTYAMKWFFPLALILYYGLRQDDKRTMRDVLGKCLDFWSIYVPVSLIVEYLLGIGSFAYYDAGFKGLYYSTNDLALVLIVLFIYSLHKALNSEQRIIIVICLLNFISIIILSTKSSVIFAIVSVGIMVVTSKSMKKRHLLSIIGISLISIAVLSVIMREQISNFILRYSTMWNNTSNDNLLTHFFSFATSGRTDRIDDFMGAISDGNNFFSNILFGWIYPDNAHVIEMDWHDSLCQYGVIGFLIIIVEYFTLIIKCKVKVQPYVYIVAVCFVYSILAGHVINGAFSGTAFAIVFSILLLDSQSKKESI